MVRADTGAALALVVFAMVGAAGFWAGGGHDAMASEHGRFRDMIARALGFRVEAVTITGQKELDERVILRAAGLEARTALPFLDAGETRERLKQLPLVRDAEIVKLYPNQLVITVKEREPFAVWQKQGQLAVVARDGTVIDRTLEPYFAELPFVVGEGANLRVQEYAKLLDLAHELRVPVRAGVLVSSRRWTLRLENGVDVKLPETDPEAALSKLAQLDRDTRLLQKDVAFIDMRAPGRVTARLSNEAYTEFSARRAPKKANAS
jgi:cell division protein FtsQ